MSDDEQSRHRSIRAPATDRRMTTAMYPKANIKNWAKVDHLTVAQAAALWEEIEPFPGHSIPQGCPAYARQTQLKILLSKRGHIPRGHGKAKAAQPVSRDLLMQIADELGERPAFLYPDEVRPVQRKTIGMKSTTADRGIEIVTEVERCLEICQGQKTRAYKMAKQRLQEIYGPKIDVGREYRRYRTLKRQNGSAN